MVNFGAPLSDQPRLLAPNSADLTEIGAVGEGAASGGTVKVGEAEAAAISLGLVNGIRVGDGDGVDVEINCGVGIGVSVGLGVWPNATSATRDVVKAKPIKVFRMEWDRRLDARRLLRGFSQSMDYLLALPAIGRQSFVWQ
jgi:hypothetical protein